MAAGRDLLNLLQREARHQRGRKLFFFVEHGGEDGNLIGREQEPPDQLIHEEELAACWELLRDVESGCDDDERCVLCLLLRGEVSTAVYAAALGISHETPEKQALVVKCIKDRLKKRIQRWRRSA
jgi:hypothetical protein